MRWCFELLLRYPLAGFRCSRGDLRVFRGHSFLLLVAFGEVLTP
jgi:hypothetical protein